VSDSAVITSTALFYPAGSDDPIPYAWYERALGVFEEFKLSPIMFTAGGGPFELDDCYLLEDGLGEIYRWGDPVPIRRARSSLVKSLKARQLTSVGLDTPRADSQYRSEWRANIDASSFYGEAYVGIDQDLISSPVALMWRACEMAHDLFPVRYGFSYQMPLRDLPDCYSSGSGRTTLADALYIIRHRREWENRTLGPDEKWKKELSDGKRHLQHHFRGAYPANLLSTDHVNKADLINSPIGKLSQFNDELWIWELSDSERSEAEARLRAKNALIE